MIIDALAVTEIISVAKCIIIEAQSFIYRKKQTVSEVLCCNQDLMEELLVLRFSIMELFFYDRHTC